MVTVKKEYSPVEDKTGWQQLLPEVKMKESVKHKVAPKKASIIKRELEVLERELRHLHEIQWTYAKQLLKFGVASWIFGLSTFFLAIIILDASLLGRMQPISILLLVFAAAAPLWITAMRIRKFQIKINRMEYTRGTLLAGHQRAILKRIVELRKTARYGDAK
jgi:hypothetical protein